MSPFEKHLFICTNRRDASDPRGCCASKGSEEIREFFKSELKKRGLKGRMRANAAGCLDQCAKGPTLVIYPEGTWYHVPTVEDARQILDEHLERGKVVDRLLLFEGKKRE
ncbi:MAG: (2Fe-2S) ferredoxin domain-containing protein [bacterium]